MSYYFQPQNLLSTFGKQSNAKYSKSLSHKTSLNKNIFSNYNQNQQNNKLSANNHKQKVIQQKHHYQKIIKQRYQPNHQNQKNSLHNFSQFQQKYLCTEPSTSLINQGKKLNIKTQNDFQFYDDLNVKNDIYQFQKKDQKKMKRIQSIDKLNCRINLAIEDIAISICQSKCKSKSQLQSIKAPLKQLSRIQVHDSRQHQKSIKIHHENNKTSKDKNSHQKSIKTQFSQSFSKRFFDNENLENLINKKQNLRSKEKFETYSKSINLKKNTGNDNYHLINHIKSSFSIQDQSLKESLLQEKSMKQSVCESSFDVDLISDKLRQISNKIDSHQKNMVKFKYNQTGKQNFFFEEQTEKKIMPKSLVNSRKLRLKTTQSYSNAKKQLDQSNRLKTNKKSHLFEAIQNSIQQNKFQEKQNISSNNLNLQQQRKSPHFKDDIKKQYSKRLKTQENCFSKVDFKINQEKQAQIKCQYQNKNHPLIKTLLKQIQLDNDLRYTKHMYFGTVILEHQNGSSYQKPNSNYKWKLLSEQLQANGLDLTINQIKEIFMPKKDELDPFMSVSYSHQELVHSLIYAYQTAQIHWQKNIYQKWEYWDLRQIQLTIENIDRDRKGFINAQDLTTFINITADTQFRNRDLILIFNRFIKNRDTMPYKQYANKSGQDEEKLKFKTIVDNLIKKQHKSGFRKANLNCSEK